MNRPTPVGFWARILCGLGFHKKDFAFGWVVHLDKSVDDGYEGAFHCGRCGIILPGPRKRRVDRK